MSGTLVQDIETTAISPLFRSYRSFLDEKAPGEVLASRKFYEKVDAQEESLHSSLLLGCRTRAWFIRNSSSGEVRLASKQCRLRWCFHCSEARQQFITQAVSPWYLHIHEPKLLTVTLKHNQNPLIEQIDFLYKSFRKLRSRKRFKDACKGGIWFFQITYNSSRQEWHPHIHALIDSKYISHHYLIAAWEKITQGSTIVHIRQVHNPEKTLSHNARYAARPSSLLSIPESRWCELFSAFDGRRIVGTWGEAKCISLRPKKPDDAADWESIGSFSTVFSLKSYDPDAIAIWESWIYDKPLKSGISFDDIEDFLNGRDDHDPPPVKEWITNPIFDWNGNN